MYDVAIIGAGVIGTSIARELRRFNINVVVLDKENDVSCGATKANSGIIHAGYDATANSLKGILNAKGNFMYDKVARELAIPFKRVGSLVVALSEEEMTTLDELLTNGKKLNIPGLKIIGREEAYKIEPNLAEGVRGALLAPTAGVVEPWEIAIAYMENAVENGAELKLNFKVKDIIKVENEFVIKSEKEEIRASIVINAAGIYADNIYKLVSDKESFTITPRKGQYFLLDKSVGRLVNSIIFPCPTKLGKGILVLHTVDDNILVGPDSQDLDLDSKDDVSTTSDRLLFIRTKASSLVKNIPFNKNITTFSGLRAEPSGGDFIIEESKDVKSFINVAGIKSPGLSSAPAIAEYVVEIVRGIRTEFLINEDFNPIRRPRIKVGELTDEQRNVLIKENPKYGKIICRCEMISEGEIVDAIKRHCGATTLNGVKRRVRPGSGRCQGGFCGPRVVEIIARELGISPTEVLQESVGSNVLTGDTKD